uniref:DUF1579 domain-containing protein n=1 Tax=Schlesneria paludicola TaxID=360056 RepID=A0A7C2P5T0_9PLAN
MQAPEPQREHQWLQRLVGEWTFEVEMSMGPDQPPTTSRGRESVRSLGGLWTIGEGSGETPDGGAHKSIMTLGYDPHSQRFVGTFISSMMAYLWPYQGTLDAAEQVLTLDSEGPGFTDQGAMARYQDIIEFISDDHRTLSSQFLGPDGQWVSFMKAHYRRQR